MFVGQRAQRFAQQADLRHAHGELAVVGFEQRAFRADDVAHVPMVERIQHLLAHAFVVQIKLDLPRCVLDGGEAGFAHLAFEHHAPRDFHGHGLRVQLFFAHFAVLRVQIGGECVAAEIVGEGDALLADFVQFFAAQGDDLVFV